MVRFHFTLGSNNEGRCKVISVSFCLHLLDFKLPFLSLRACFHFKSKANTEKQQKLSLFILFFHSLARAYGEKWKMIFKFFIRIFVNVKKKGSRKCWFDSANCFWLVFPLSHTARTQELSCIISGNMTLIVWSFHYYFFFSLALSTWYFPSTLLLLLL